VEDAVSSAQRSNVDGDDSLQEFDHEEVVTATSMEEGLSSLQLIPTRDIQSPTISTQREASTEKRRPESSIKGHSALGPTGQHQQPEVATGQSTRVSTEELDELWQLTADLNRRLEQQNRSPAQVNNPGGGFYPARHVGQGEPLATGATFEQEVQHPDGRFCGHQGNAYSVYPHGASFYGHAGNTNGMYPGGLWNTPRPEAYFCGRPDNAYSACPNGVQRLSPDASTMEVNKVLLEQQQAVGNQPTENRGPTSGKSVVQFCESMTPGSTVMQLETGSRQNTTVKTSAEQTPMNETTELDTAGTVYHTARTKCDDSSDRSSLRLNQSYGLKKEKFSNMIAMTQKTTCLTCDDTGKRRRERMQKRARLDIRHVSSTVRQNGQAIRRMQKWARLNIRCPRNLTARHKTGQLIVQVAIKSDYQQVNLEALQRKVESVTNGSALCLEKRGGKMIQKTQV